MTEYLTDSRLIMVAAMCGFSTLLMAVALVCQFFGRQTTRRRANEAHAQRCLKRSAISAMCAKQGRLSPFTLPITKP